MFRTIQQILNQAKKIIGRPDKGTSVLSLTTATTAATAMFPNSVPI